MKFIEMRFEMDRMNMKIDESDGSQHWHLRAPKSERYWPGQRTSCRAFLAWLMLTPWQSVTVSQ